MPLDPQELLRQIEAAVPNLKTGFQRLESSVEEALDVYKKAQAGEWRELALNSQSRQALGYPLAGLRQNNPVAAQTGPYTVVATDGSVIPPDRHNGTALYHVINTGRVMLRYGPDSRAEIDSKTLFFAGDVTEEELESSAPLVIDLKRDLYELTFGLDLARQYKADLVLMDGPLTMWNSRTLTDRQSNELRQNYYNLLNVFAGEQIPIVGYISNTHSQAVTNSLRLLMAERPQASMFDLEDIAPQPARSKSTAGKRKERLSGLNGVHDALLFRHLLGQNHASEIFKTAFSEPKELAEHIQEVCFCYWRTENEIVRLEFPEWLAAPELLPEVLSMVDSQHRLGQGYPVALMEAHESAVLRGDDRELLRILLEERGLLQAESEKGRSKRLRGV
jgi:hypothetical protein